MVLPEERDKSEVNKNPQQWVMQLVGEEFIEIEGGLVIVILDDTMYTGR